MSSRSSAGSKHFGIGAPAHDPNPNFAHACDRRAPDQRSVRLLFRLLGRMPERLRGALGDGRWKSDDDAQQFFVRDHVPRARQLGGRGVARVGFECVGRQRRRQDPLNFERPARGATLVPGEEVQGVRQCRRLDCERLYSGLARGL